MNVVIAGIEALVVSGNKILCACYKEVYNLWAQPHIDMFHQLLIVAEGLRSQPVLQVSTSKQVVVARSEIKAVRRMVKQLPVETVQQCSSASSCTRRRIVMEELYTRCRRSTPFFLNVPTQFF
jgi:hypothetical protein